MLTDPAAATITGDLTLSTFLNDVRFGARMLRRAPGFTIVAVLTLALGIGANTAMFGIVDALLFRPPSGVSDPGRLVRVQLDMPALPGEPSELSGVLSYPDFTNLRDRTRGFAAVAAYARSTASVGEGEEARSQQALLVTGGYFRLLGTRAARGRLIAPDDDRENAPLPVAVLSWDFWQRAFFGDPAVVGKTIKINDHSFTVIGVAPKHFVGTELGAPALWLPLGNAPALGFDSRMVRSRYASWLSIIGRLAPGVTREQAQASAQSALLAARDEGADLPAEGPGGFGPGAGEVRIAIAAPGGPGGAGGRPAGPPPPRRVHLGKLAGSGDGGGIPAPFGERRSMPVSLWFLAITAAVLFIACANVANLLLARATNRAHEIAVRLSLGASRWRLASQLFTESALLALLGGTAGLLLALTGVALLPRVIPLPPLPPFVDTRVLAFSAILTLATTVAFGLFPALRASRTDLQVALNASGRMGDTRHGGRMALVIGQLAVSLVLIIGAGLFLRSLRNVKAIDTGFDAEHVLFASAELRGARRTREQEDEFWQRALEHVRTMAGVRSASLAATVPFQMNIMMPVDAPGFLAPNGQPRPSQADFAGTGYFTTLGIAIKQGRAFTEDDREGSAPVAIVNETLARRIWGGAPAIGKCVRIGMSPNTPCAEVVGVAADARYADITSPPAPFLYRPLTQRPRMGPPMTSLHVRTVEDPSALAGALRRELQGLDPEVKFVNVQPMSDLIRPQTLPWRIGTLIFTLFGALGVLLAAVGLYGVLSFLVAQRTREMGVRMALGAQRRDVLTLVLGQGARLIAVGVALGIAGAAATTRLFASMMYGVSALDPVVYVATAALLVSVGLVATYVPARRATRVDPVVALRSE
jgi:putative ABC transport system permease protein